MTCAKFSLLSRNFPKLCAIALLFASFPARAGDMTSTLLMGTSRIDVVIDSGDLKVSQADLMRWVQRAAEAVSTYYGRYPVPHAGIRIIPVDGNGIRHGQTFPYNGGFIKIRVGAETLVPELDGDWMLTHEMVHLAFPSVEDNHHWMEEGISVYVEPIARIQAGQMTAVQMWSDLVRDMPKGVPHPEDTGLDHTHTWASTYWGGALYCFLADVEIRRETHNKKGLQDALRGIRRHRDGRPLREDERPAHAGGSSRTVERTGNRTRWERRPLDRRRASCCDSPRHYRPSNSEGCPANHEFATIGRFCRPRGGRFAANRRALISS
jgi:hypothetical protein